MDLQLTTHWQLGLYYLNRSWAGSLPPMRLRPAAPVERCIRANE